MFTSKLALASFLPWNCPEPALELVFDFDGQGSDDDGVAYATRPDPYATLLKAATLGLGPPRGRVACVVARVGSEKARDAIQNLIWLHGPGWHSEDPKAWLEQEMETGRIRFEIVQDRVGSM
jgi:hypothetical protein